MELRTLYHSIRQSFSRLQARVTSTSSSWRPHSSSSNRGGAEANNQESTTVTYIQSTYCTNIFHRLGKFKPADYKKDPLLEPFRHIYSKPGKGVHDQLIKALNHWLFVPEDQLRSIVDAVRKLHTANLLIDDIEDSSHLRRGVPAAHTIYGIPQTINSANYMYFLALQELISLPIDIQAPQIACKAKDSVVDIVTSEILSLHQGQGLEIFWRDHLSCPSEEDYIDMVVKKTGGLLRMAIRLMELLSPVEFDDESRSLIPLVNLIAIYYQIRDDYMNLQSKEYESKKGFADDLTEGKFSFPVIHGIQSDNKNRLLLNVLRTRPTRPAPKNLAIAYLQQQGSFVFTCKVLKHLEQVTRDEIKRLGGNPKLEQFMERIYCPDPHPPLNVKPDP